MERDSTAGARSELLGVDNGGEPLLEAACGSILLEATTRHRVRARTDSTLATAVGCRSRAIHPSVHAHAHA